MSLKQPPIIVSSSVTPRGHVDALNGRMLSGWIYDESRPNEPIDIEVISSQGIFLGKGCADIYRADLEESGMGNGCHCFSVRLNQDVFDSSVTSLVLLNAKDRSELQVSEFVIDKKLIATAKINNLNLAGIHGEVVVPQTCFEKTVPQPTTNARRSRIRKLFKPEKVAEPIVITSKYEASVSVYIDNAFAASKTIVLEPKAESNAFSIYLPAKYYDGNPHLFEVEISSQLTECEVVSDILPAVCTNWDEIRDSSKHRGYASLSKISSFRYESLRSQMSRIARGEVSHDLVGNLESAHDMVVKGAGGTQNFTGLRLPKTANPKVSIVIPVYNNFAITYHCLASIVLNAGSTEFEVIVIDDCSTDETLDLSDIIVNCTVIRNEENLGFLHSCNLAASNANGEFIVLLNNDTEVTSGWLEELLDVFDRFSNVGAVGSKLIYPNGLLQDAGGLVWSSGTPWNVGHGQNPDDPSFNYVREVDYLTAAAVAVKTSVWNQVGGFSTEYAPAYYEDTDLSFKIREAGFRTLFCPHSTVIHFEGMSNGTDLNSGIKQYQHINSQRFVNTWKHQFTDNGTEGVDPHLAQDRNREFRVLMIDHAFPCLGQDAGSYAAIQEIKLLIALGCKITFVPHNFQHKGKHTEYLQRLGVECLHAPFQTSVGVLLQQRGFDFDAIYITRYDVAQRVLPAVREHSNAVVIFNNADLHFLREMRAAILQGETDMAGPIETRDNELAVMSQVDAILSYNETEHNIIASHLMRSDNIFKCPWVLEDKRPATPIPNKEGIAFMGGFGHPPNLEAMIWLCNEVMPLLLETHPHIKLSVWGSGMSDEVYDLESDNVVIKGFAESLDDIFHTCKIFVAPLLSGAGIKGKVLDSVAYGVPTILSPVAVEATGLQDEYSTRVASTPSEWAEKIAELYGSDELGNRLSSNASQLMDTEYSFESGVQRMRAVMESVGLTSNEMMTDDMTQNIQFKSVG